MIGPYKIRFYHPATKVEAFCHHCRWSCFEWTVPEASASLAAHIDRTHLNPPPPYHPTAHEMPGR